MTKDLLFIALLPDEAVSGEVTQLKQAAAELFGASHALNSPPHITLIPPFRQTPDSEKRLIHALGKFADGQASFEIELNGFGVFPRGVIYIGVTPNRTLNALYSRVSSKFFSLVRYSNEEEDLPFHPHVTIANRDLKQEVFETAKDHFSKITYCKTFQADKLCILKHYGNRWNVLESFPFGS